MNTLTIKDVEYKIGTLNTKQQWHVARRIGPVLAAALGAAAAMENADDAMNAFASIVPVAELLARMSDADSDFVTDTCLSVCQRKQDKEDRGWARVITPTGQIMFQDMNMDVMLTLTIEVIKQDIIPFFPTSQFASLLGQ